METWQPITEAKLSALLTAQLTDCLPNQQQLFERFKVIPYLVPIARSGKIGTVFVVAKLGDVILYYEDVEEGFNVSELTQDGSIATPGNEQWELRHALWHLAAV